MWRVATEVNSRKVLITGPEGRYVFQVFHGHVSREILNALKAIQHPVLRRKIRDGFDVRCPVRHRAWKNTGDRRKFILLRPPGKAATELRLISPHQHITKAFLHALKDVMERKVDPGTTMEELRSRAVESGRRGGLSTRDNQQRRTA